MGKRGFWELGGMSDAELEGGLRQLLTEGRTLEARIVAHLAEVDARRMHSRGGLSLFAYCIERLGLSEMEAFYRITAARLAQKYPAIFELLDAGRVHLTGLCLLRKVLTKENHAQLLEEISGKSKRQIERLLAARFPRADVEERLARLAKVEPLSPDRYLLQLTISGELKAKLELACDLTSHANSSRDLATVIERAVDSYLDRVQARRFGTTQRPRRRPSAESRSREIGETVSEPQRAPTAQARRRAHVPNGTRREVATRDGICCSFVAEDGTRCGSRAFLELHHEKSWAKGGRDDASNLRYLCASHNRLLAEQELGQAHVAHAIEQHRHSCRKKQGQD